MNESLHFLAPANPLRRAGYRYLMSFSLIVAMGGGFHFIGSYWILYRDTSSPSSVARLIMAYWVPSLFVMPFAGVLSWLFCDRRSVVVCRRYWLADDSTLVSRQTARSEIERGAQHSGRLLGRIAACAQ